MSLSVTSRNYQRFAAMQMQRGTLLAEQARGGERIEQRVALAEDRTGNESAACESEDVPVA